MAPPTLNASFVKDLIDEASKALEDGELSMNELISLGALLAEKLGAFSQLTGEQKKELVLHSIQEAITVVVQKEIQKNLSAEQLESFKQKLDTARKFAETTIPLVLSLMVKAAQGQIAVTPQQATAVQSNVAKFFSCLLRVLTLGATAPKKVEKGVELLTLTKTDVVLPTVVVDTPPPVDKDVQSIQVEILPEEQKSTHQDPETTKSVSE
jgi:hypothetical protein